MNDEEKKMNQNRIEDASKKKYLLLMENFLIRLQWNQRSRVIMTIHTRARKKSKRMPKKNPAKTNTRNMRKKKHRFFLNAGELQTIIHDFCLQFSLSSLLVSPKPSHTPPPPPITSHQPTSSHCLIYRKKGNKSSQVQSPNVFTKEIYS